LPASTSRQRGCAFQAKAIRHMPSILHQMACGSADAPARCRPSVSRQQRSPPREDPMRRAGGAYSFTLTPTLKKRPTMPDCP
jgi:hypothetical protein